MAEETVEAVLNSLNDHQGPVSTIDLAKELGLDHQKVVGAIKSIAAQAESMLVVQQDEFKKLELTEEGEIILKNGSHEARIFENVLKSSDGGITQSDLLKCIPDASMAKVGFSKAMSNGWIQMNKETRKITAKVDKIEDSARKLIESIANLTLDEVESKNITDLKKRKLVTESVIKYMIIEKGRDFKLTIDKPETDLTTALLQSGSWKEKKFKDYNFDALGIVAGRGCLHPLLKVREQFVQLFTEMGFTEMPTNNFVENSFWNFDALIVPQAHPARDSQDTFFISQPEFSSPIKDRDLVSRVRDAHHGSKDGSWPRGYRYDWIENESQKNILRTHTTAVTARLLYKLAQEHKISGDSKFKPAKLFSIDRVFRNETLDATHLAEFNQVEGVVVDEKLTLGDLMGILEAFFAKLGITKLRFKPAYNPYTEPSMEIFSFHPGLNKWVEVGNSGVFRPELLKAVGLPSNITAIAWGLSLERPTMIKYKFNNIRELVGHKVNIEMVQASPLCLF